MVKSQQFALVNEDLLGLGSRSYVLASWADGNLHPGGPSLPGLSVEVQGVLGAYGAGQDFITEGGDPTSAADIDGDGADEGLQRLAIAPPAVVDAGTAVASNTTRRALSDATDALTQRPGGARSGPARAQPQRFRCSRPRHGLWDAGAVGDALRYASGGTHLLSMTSLLFPAADSELPTACA